MNNNQKTSPATVAALVAGCCLAVGFAAWSITRAMNPSAPAKGTTTTATTGTVAPAPLDLAGPAPLTPEQQRRVAGGEAGLAPHADPFGLLPQPPRAVAATRPPALPPLAAGSPGGNRPPVLPAVTSWPGGPGDLPPMRPLPAFGGPGPGPGGQGTSRSTPVRALPPRPELIGTLLGAHPSAVFRSGGEFTVVPVGGSVGGWRLLTVEHGGVVIRSGAETARVLVGGKKPDGIITAESKPPAVPALSPTAPLAPPTAPPALPTPQPDPKAAPPQVPRAQPVARVTVPVLDAVAATEDVAEAVVATTGALAIPAPGQLVEPGARPAVTLGPAPRTAVATVENLPARVAAAASPLAAAEPGKTPEVSLGTEAAGVVTTAEMQPGRRQIGQQPALLLASEPSGMPLTPSPALVSQPRPAKPGVSATGTVVLTGEHPQPPAEKAPERYVDPAPLPGRIILDWADEAEPEEPARPDTPTPS